MSFAGANPAADSAPAPSQPSEADAADNATQQTNDSEATVTDETDQDGETDPAGQTDDTEEIDLDGETIRLAKKLAEKIKSGFMKNADYTQKTMSLAEARKAVEAEKAAATQLRQSIDAELNERAELHAVKQGRKSISDYINSPAFAQLQAEDPQRASQLQWQYMQLGEQETTLNATLKEKAQARETESQQESAKALQAAATQIAQKFPQAFEGAQFTNELDVKLGQYGTAEGYAPDLLKEAAIRAPQFLITLNKARLYDEQRAAAKVAKRAAVNQLAAPAAEVGTKAGVSATKNPSEMSMAEYAKWRSNGGGETKR